MLHLSLVSVATILTDVFWKIVIAWEVKCINSGNIWEARTPQKPRDHLLVRKKWAPSSVAAAKKTVFFGKLI
jgi:hypothetical protein